MWLDDIAGPCTSRNRCSVARIRLSRSFPRRRGGGGSGCCHSASPLPWQKLPERWPFLRSCLSSPIPAEARNCPWAASSGGGRQATMSGRQSSPTHLVWSWCTSPGTWCSPPAAWSRAQVMYRTVAELSTRSYAAYLQAPFAVSRGRNPAAMIPRIQRASEVVPTLVLALRPESLLGGAPGCGSPRPAPYLHGPGLTLLAVCGTAVLLLVPGVLTSRSVRAVGTERTNPGNESAAGTGSRTRRAERGPIARARDLLRGAFSAVGGNWPSSSVVGPW